MLRGAAAVARELREVSGYNDGMSQEPPDPIHTSHPTSASGLFLRSILIGAAIVVGVIGIVWYATRQ